MVRLERVLLTESTALAPKRRQTCRFEFAPFHKGISLKNTVIVHDSPQSTQTRYAAQFSILEIKMKAGLLLKMNLEDDKILRPWPGVVGHGPFNNKLTDSCARTLFI